MQVRMPEDEGDGSRDTEPVEEAQTEPVEASGPETVTTEPAVEAPSGTADDTGGRRMDDQDARNWAVGAHLAGLSSLVGIPGVIGVLVVWLIKKDDHPLVDQHGKEALNFQISLLIYAVISGVLVLLLVGLLLLGVVFIFGLVMPIIAAVKTSNGEDYRYPLTLRLIS